MLPQDQYFMQRAFDLAALGKGSVAPNPIVGALLVYQGRIIGEGYHRAYGRAHAEVNAVNSVKPHDRKYIPQATLYVSLEPCNIHGNTPPCTLLILRERIPRVVISSLDRTPGVNGSSVQRLQKAGVEVAINVLPEQGQQLSRIRNTFVQQQRPYVVLKWAQSADGLFAPEQQRQFWLTNAFSKRLVHKWRSELDSVLVGYQTALADNPRLNNRLYYGPQPSRIVIDREGTLPLHLNIFDGSLPTIVLTAKPLPADTFPRGTKVLPAVQGENWPQKVLSALAGEGVSSVLVEGGEKTLRAFIQSGYWDEARVFKAARFMGKGRPAPLLDIPPKHSYRLGGDQLLWYLNSLNLH
jgi:diaminohydroxyphosphoribosylaminopyrimidine deaminase / 5-amino-6-(5-phosphoribosylamino)uracil reductase